MPDTNPATAAVDRTRLRKALGFALRHNPWAFGLDLAEDGSTPLGDVVASLRSRLPEFRALSADEAAATVRDLDAERFEVRDGRVRARYGHSFPVHQFAPAAVPPDTLFHGTTDGTSVTIYRDGLRPMGRYYVHLTSDPDYAAGVGTAKGVACVLRVRARAAYDAGVLFYRANAHVWLVAEVPAEYLVLRVESGGQIWPTPSAKSTG